MAITTHDGTEVTKGSKWRDAKMRGVWTVQSAGAKQIRLKPSVPGLGTQTVETDRFCASDSPWTRV